MTIASTLILQHEESLKTPKLQPQRSKFYSMPENGVPVIKRNLTTPSHLH